MYVFVHKSLKYDIVVGFRTLEGVIMGYRIWFRAIAT